MSANPTGRKRPGPIHLGEVVARVIEPAAARRGLMTADLVSAWPDIVGPAHAPFTTPERLVWRRRKDGGNPEPGTLVLRVDGPRAILVQHELPQIVERINTFFGYVAVDRVRLVQGPVARPTQPVSEPRTLSEADAARLGRRLAGIGDEGLRDALERLGRGVLGSRRE